MQNRFSIVSLPGSRFEEKHLLGGSVLIKKESVGLTEDDIMRELDSARRESGPEPLKSNAESTN